MKNNFKVLLLNPPRGKNLTQDLLHPPLNIVSLYSFIKENKYPIKALDMFYSYPKKIINFLKNNEFSVVGITCFTEQREEALKLAKQIKLLFPNIKIVLGGVHASLMYKQILNNYNFIDYLVIGEGELTFLELIESLKNDKEPANIPGIAYLNNKKEIIKTQSRSLIQNLDQLPFSDFSSFNLTKYPLDLIFQGEKFNHIPPKNFTFLPLLSSRGCVYNCSYCLVPFFWEKKWRFRTPQNIIKEIKLLKANYPNLFINFIDDIFTINSKRVKEICNLIKINKLKFFWSCFSRVDTITEDMLEDMKKTGCYYISYGVESAAKKILKNINKNISLEKTKEVFYLTHKIGIKIEANLIVGLPGEDRNSIKETKLFLKETQPDFLSISIAKIFPSTPLYKLAKSKGFIDENYWLTFKPAPFYTLEKNIKFLKQGEKTLKRVNLKEKILLKIKQFIKDKTIFKATKQVLNLNLKD